MNYETHEFEQGSDSWHAHRANCYNASDAGTALGVNPYKSRQELVRELASGFTKEIDAGTQRRFDDGHRFERLARGLAERIMGEDLFPIVASIAVPGLRRRLSVSLDGSKMDDSETWEHKTLSESLSAAMDRGEIPEQYHGQMEQGLAIVGATRCLFMASKWDDSDHLIDEKHIWYESNPELRAKIIAAWKQIEADVDGYQHVEPAPIVTAAPIRELPALMVEISGSVTASNLLEWKEIVTERIAGINTDLQTDQDFADADQMVKFLDDGEKRIVLVKSQAQANAADIDRVFRALDEIKDSMRAKRLELDKLVTRRKESIKIEIMQAGKDALATHIAGLNKRLAKVQMPAIAADFAAAIKGKRNLESMRGAVADLVAAKKIESNEIADRITINLQALHDGTRLPNADYTFLFSDFAQLILKAPDDLALVIKSRISDHKTAEAKKLEAIKEAARVEAEANAAAKVKADADAKAKAEQDAAEAQHKAGEEAAAKIERDRAAVSTYIKDTATPPITEPAAQPAPVASSTRLEETAVAAAPTHKGITGTARLRDEIDDLLIDFDAVELIAAIQALRSIKARRDTRVAA